MKRSFFLKIFSGYLLIIIILSGVVLLFSFDKIHDFHITSLTQDLKGMGVALRPVVIPLLQKGRYNELDATVKKLDPEMHARITVVNPAGTVLADSEQDPRAMENHGSRPEIKEAIASRVGTSIRYSTTVREKMLYVAVPVDENGKRLGVIRVSLFLRDINGFIAALKVSLAQVTFLVGLLALLFAALFSRFLSKPLAQFADAAKRMAAGDFMAKVYLRKSDEFSGLADSFNFMTERVRALFSELSQQKAELHAIIASLQEGLLVVDKHEKAILCNDSFRRVAGTESIPGKHYWEVLRESEFIQLVKNAAVSRGNFSGEVTIGDKTYLCSASYIPGSEEVVAVMHDITEIKILEKVKRDFTANVSHELRTPLTAIKGYVETIEDGIDETNRGYLEIIKRHTERLVNIVEDLLSLSELEERGIQFVPVDMGAVISNSASMFAQKAEKKGLSLNVRLPGKLPPMNGDQFRLEQMFINLIDNAVKYTEKGSVEISAAARGENIEIRIEDTGIGIPAEHLSRIFERFYVVDKSRTRKLGGTGLGLSIVKHIVLLHQGAIRAESIPGKGCAFVVSLPLMIS